ncbi:TIR domain-containing protein [Sorangium cellulosum]|nr:TIR domain-containing protein [Sorangium cellulosum]
MGKEPMTKPAIASTPPAEPPSGRTRDVFVSYAEEDTYWVEGALVDALRRAGLRCTTERAFALGVPRVLEFARAIEDAERTVLVLSPAYRVDRLGRFVSLLARSFHLERAQGAVLTLKLSADPLPAHLHGLEVIEADQTGRTAAIAELCRCLGRELPPAARKPPCPYPGMTPFRERGQFFYGREREIAEILAAIEESVDVFIIGPSGSGKSSLISAGLLPLIEDAGLGVRALRPGASPLRALEQALEGPARSSPGRRAAREILVVDQLEELFSQGDRTAQRQFVSRVAAARERGVSLVAAMRADFYPDLMNTALWPLEGPTRRRLEILPLRGDALRDAIVKPAARVEVHVESALVERLIAEAEGEPGALPLLQEVLVLLWERMRERVLTLDSYQPPGAQTSHGLNEALARRATHTYAELAPEQQVIARRILVQLVQFGRGRADAKRQSSRLTLATREQNQALFERTLDYLIGSRLLTADGDSKDATVELSHEALITAWPAFQEWLRTWRDREETLRRLEGKVDDWRRLGRGEGGLLDRAELPDAERWLASEDAEVLGYPADLRALVEASQRAIEEERLRELRHAQAIADEQRQRAEAEKRRADAEAARAQEAKQAAARLRRRAITIGILASLVLAGGGVASWTWQQRMQVERERSLHAQRAAEEAQKALANEIVGVASRVDDPLLGALLLAELPDVPEPRRGPWIARQIANGLLPMSAIFMQDEKPMSARVESADFNGRGDRIALGWSDGTISIVSADGRGARVDLRTGFGSIRWLRFDEERQAVIAWLGGHSNGTLAVVPLDGTSPPRLAEMDISSTQFPSVLSDGTLVVARADGTLRMWRWEGSERGLKASAERRIAVSIDKIALAADGRRAVVWNFEGVWIIDVEAGSTLGRLAGPLVGGTRAGGDVLDVDFDPRGERIVTISSEEQVLLWTVVHGRLQGPSGLPDSVPHAKPLAVAFSLDGARVLAAYDNQKMRFWEDTGSGLAHGKTYNPIDFDSRTHSAMFDIQREAVLFGTAGGTVVCAIRPRCAPRALGGVDETVLALSRVETEERAVTVGGSALRVWRLRDQKGVEELPASSQREFGVSVLSDDGKLALLSQDDKLQLYFLSSRRAVDLEACTHAPARGAWFSGDDRRLLVEFGDGVAGVYGVDPSSQTAGACRRLAPSHERPCIEHAAFSPMDTRVAIVCSDVRIIDPEGGSAPLVIQDAPPPVPEEEVSAESSDWIEEAVFTPDGEHLLVRHFRGAVYMCPSRAQNRCGAAIHAGRGKAALLSDGTGFASGTYTGEYKLWQRSKDGRAWAARLLDGKMPFFEDAGGLRIAKAPQGPTVGALGFGKGLVWRPEEQYRPVSLAIPMDADSLALAVGADGVLATRSPGEVLLWPKDGRGQPLKLGPGSAGTFRLRFGPDTKHIVTASERGVMLWPIGWVELKKVLRAATTACLTPEQRRQYLQESLPEAQQAYEKCEVSFGRQVPAVAPGRGAPQEPP